MENLNGSKFEDKNILVYIKGKEMKKFEAISSIEKLTIAPTLMYATLIPWVKKDRLIEWVKTNEDFFKSNEIKIQLRSSIDRKKIIHQN